MRFLCIAVTDVAGPEGEAPFAALYNYTHTDTHIRSIPRRVEHEITRNEMTHPPRIISRKRLIKVCGSTMRTNKTRSAFTHWYALVRTRDRRRWDTHISFCIRCFSPRSSFFLLFSLSPPCRRRRGDAPQKRRMICNFNNQSHERRLIFIMITPPLYLAWEREFEIGVPTQNGPHGTKKLHRSPRVKGTLQSWLVVIRELICLSYYI